MKNQESRFGINIGPFVICRRKQLEDKLVKAEEKAFKRIYGSGKSCTGECVIPVEEVEDYRRIYGGPEVMSIQIDKAAYEQLIREDIARLNQMGRVALNHSI